MRREHYTLPGAGTIVQQPEEGEVLSPRCCGGGPGPRPAAATYYLRVTVPSPLAPTAWATTGTAFATDLTATDLTATATALTAFAFAAASLSELQVPLLACRHS